ncbi:MAG: DUF4040 domain-containing protein, partial [Thioalkalispiraceae bacterium]
MTELIWPVLDVILIVSALALAWFSLNSRDLRRAVILFIAFGLLLALIWVRLKAPDVALAEAAIGAGLTGALLLSAVARHNKPATEQPIQERQLTRLFKSIPFGVLFILLGLALSLALLASLMSGAQSDLAQQIFERLPETGVTNPVTGVLLDIRAYDTMLELAVLLAAGFGVMALAPANREYPTAGLILLGLTRVIVPLLIVFSGYLLWVGAQAPGGAFQAAALLAAAGVVMRLVGHRRAGLPQGFLLRAVMISGVAVFLIIALAVMASGQVFFDYPTAWSALLILLIETFATLSIAVTLVIAYLSGQPSNWIDTTTNKH